MRSDTYFADMAEDAMQTAYKLGYRPCNECGCWYVEKNMVISQDDDGAKIHTCHACYLPEHKE